ncbi:MAG: aspartate-semialdehyde dehydrogenase [Sphingobacteriales bacterium]|nr:aspartate-semialdehyde dehydrogenase [Sphingobacteriales bacterium]
MKVAVVGATGLVGRIMLQVLEERKFPVKEIIPVASEKSVGQRVIFKKREYTVRSVEAALAARPDIAIFSAGGSTSLELAPRFAAIGTTVIDNSSAWRMHPDKRLIVPEINAALLTADDKIIANPNCSTIQMVMALYPLHKKYHLKRLVVSTYQSVTGTGKKAVQQLFDEREGNPKIDRAYHYQIDLNCIPQCDVFADNGYTKEEMKLVNETRKILGDDSIGITATAVRVPVIGGHSESVNATFRREFSLDMVRQILQKTKGVILLDDPATLKYTMTILAKDKNEVFVGRLRRDDSQAKTLNMWIVADNLRKGAATNAVQIAEYLLRKKLVGG